MELPDDMRPRILALRDGHDVGTVVHAEHAGPSHEPNIATREPRGNQQNARDFDREFSYHDRITMNMGLVYVLCVAGISAVLVLGITSMRDACTDLKWCIAQCWHAFPIAYALLARYKLARAEKTNQQLTSQLESLMNFPFVDKAPSGMSQQHLQRIMDMAWQYSLNGIEGHRAGHILAIGPADKILEQGNCRGTNHVERGEPRFLDSHHDDVMIEMNFDGAHVFNGSDGRIVATRFFAHRAPFAVSGGAGEACALGLSSVQGSVVFKISADGGIKEFRDGCLFKRHCGSRPVIQKCNGM